MTDETRCNLGPLAASWLRSLRSQNKSENTVKVYGNAANAFTAFLLDPEEGYRPALNEDGSEGKPPPAGPEEIHREHVEAYVIAVMERTSPTTANQHFRSLKTMFNWLVAEEEIERSPMLTMKAPKITEKEVPVIPDEDLAKLFKACKGKSFAERRDTAILLMYLDTGVRLSEGADRRVGDFDLDLNVVRVLGKADKFRSVPFGRTTALALDRYLRAAAKHRGGRPLEEDSWMWWGNRNAWQRLTMWGVGTMLKRRCAEAGIAELHPHQFRHTLAHQWKMGGGNEDDLMRITGWTSRQMLSRYGASAGAERARAAHQRLSPADRLK